MRTSCVIFSCIDWNEVRLVGADEADQAAGVLLREEALRDDDVQVDVERRPATSSTSTMTSGWRSAQPRLRAVAVAHAVEHAFAQR